MTRQPQTTERPRGPTLAQLQQLYLQGNRASYELIPHFDCYTPVVMADMHKGPFHQPPRHTDCLLHYQAAPYEEYAHDYVEQFYHLPVLLLHDDSIWQRATRFMMALIHKDTAVSKLPSPAALEKKAKSLKEFADFFVSEGFDYLICQRRTASPLRRYRRYLNDRIAAGELQPATVKTYMSHLVAFYRYLISTENIRFAFPPWEDSEGVIFFHNQSGQSVAKQVTCADVAQVSGITRSTPKDAGFRGRIADGGDLRPLDEAEQDQLLIALLELKNTEMNLIHLNGLLSGARRQSVLTWRRHQFEPEARPNERGEVMLRAGSWPGRTVADCKDSRNVGKTEQIWLPEALYRQMQVYLASPRAQNRLDRAQDKAPRNDIGDQYVFLSQQGNPLYMAKTDINRPRYRKPPDGQALEVFIAECLRPKLRQLGFQAHYKYHDTRATFGMNLVRAELEALKAKHPDWDNGKILEAVFGLVRSRLNHSNLETTQQYLSFDFKSEVSAVAQADYEGHLAILLESVS